MRRIAVFASGSGSNFQSIQESIKDGRLRAEIALLVCDRPDAYVVKRASKEGIPVFAFVPSRFESKAAFEREIVTLLKERQIDLLVLAGYMRLIGDTLLQAYPNKIVNIHPSLLPAFPGKDAVGQAIAAGVRVTGVTIHFVDEGMDTGPIIDQASVRIHPDDSREMVQRSIQGLEHMLYPEVLAKLLH